MHDLALLTSAAPEDEWKMEGQMLLPHYPEQATEQDNPTGKGCMSRRTQHATYTLNRVGYGCSLVAFFQFFLFNYLLTRSGMLQTEI